MVEVSIITPTHNSNYIDETVKSVKDQTFPNWEMIIVDDCSTDKTVERIKPYIEKDKRIKLIKLEKNVGAAEARNIALRLAKGKFIAFLDSDDLWKPEKLKIQYNFMVEKDIAFSFSNYCRITEDGKKVINEIKVPEKINYSGLLRNTIIGTLTVMINREKTGYFEMPNINSSHDFALWLQILKNGFNAYGIQQSLAYYREVASSNTAKKWKAAKDVWVVYRKIEKINSLYSIYFFTNYVLNAIKKRMK